MVTKMRIRKRRKFNDESMSFKPDRITLNKAIKEYLESGGKIDFVKASDENYHKFMNLTGQSGILDF